jgi:hypothetical protein
MYSSSLHRKHKVIPVDSATDELKDDVKAIQERILKIVQQFAGMANTNE